MCELLLLLLLRYHLAYASCDLNLVAAACFRELHRGPLLVTSLEFSHLLLCTYMLSG
jgi:hypothetical protein